MQRKQIPVLFQYRKKIFQGMIMKKLDISKREQEHMK